ncbi:hypothetical protein PYCH_09720 [Pyrococcus yayanosii CH1]|uniref:Uncharacterized protein n=1 Tax=Pyrococcus yayanosii (strain CH1 / JCM 16557) TaxID=529709 RepID=F8AEH8_PYRYC|nr:hypothetical protein PYCH_09720 [Pyrococcus yayanosii CH1]
MIATFQFSLSLIGTPILMIFLKEESMLSILFESYWNPPGGAYAVIRARPFQFSLSLIGTRGGGFPPASRPEPPGMAFNSL